MSPIMQALEFQVSATLVNPANGGLNLGCTLGISTPAGNFAALTEKEDFIFLLLFMLWWKLPLLKETQMEVEEEERAWVWLEALKGRRVVEQQLLAISRLSVTQITKAFLPPILLVN